MAEGFITRRGGVSKFYEGTLDITSVTPTATISVGFEPKTVFLYKKEGSSSIVMNSFFVAFNGSDAKGCAYRNTAANASQIYTSFVDVATIVQTNDGATITLSGNSRFNGTYTVIATA